MPEINPGDTAWVLAASALVLAGGYVLCRLVVNSRFGKVLIAIRDAESRADRRRARLVLPAPIGPSTAI